MPLTKEEIEARKEKVALANSFAAIALNVIGIFLATFGVALKWGAGPAVLTAGIGVFVFGVLLGLNN